MEAATNSLLNEQAKRKERGISMQSEANVIESRGKNGLVERMNRTIKERVRCMISHAKLPNSFWEKL